MWKAWAVKSRGYHLVAMWIIEKRGKLWFVGYRNILYTEADILNHSKIVQNFSLLVYISKKQFTIHFSINVLMQNNEK